MPLHFTFSTPERLTPPIKWLHFASVITAKVKGVGCNGILIETFHLVMESRAGRGVASKFMKWTRLMIIKGGRVLDSIKMLACMFEGTYNLVAMEY